MKHPLPLGLAVADRPDARIVAGTIVRTVVSVLLLVWLGAIGLYGWGAAGAVIGAALSAAIVAYIFVDEYRDNVFGTDTPRRRPEELDPKWLADRRFHVASLMAMTAVLTVVPILLLATACARML